MADDDRLRALMREYQDGRFEAFDELYAAVAPALRRYLLSQARDKLNLSARALHRVLRVARTIADLDMPDPENETGPDLAIGPVHLAEALQLRRAID